MRKNGEFLVKLSPHFEFLIAHFAIAVINPSGEIIRVRIIIFQLLVDRRIRTIEDGGDESESGDDEADG